MKIETIGNRLFVDDKEYLCWRSGRYEPSHYSPIVCHAVSPDEQQIVTIDRYGKIFVRRKGSTQSHDVHGEIQGTYAKDTTVLAVSNDGKNVAIHSQSRLFVLWPQLGRLMGHTLNLHLPFSDLRWVAEEDNIVLRVTVGDKDRVLHVTGN